MQGHQAWLPNNADPMLGIQLDGSLPRTPPRLEDGGKAAKRALGGESAITPRWKVEPGDIVLAFDAKALRERRPLPRGAFLACGASLGFPRPTFSCQAVNSAVLTDLRQLENVRLAAVG